VWGITPSRPGFETVTIKPQMSEITFSTIKVPTIKGAIYAEFKKTNNASLYIIDLPAGIKGKFIPVDIADSEIILNGKPVLSNDELPELKEGTNRIEIIKP
jgi:hypothetical protein